MDDFTLDDDELLARLRARRRRRRRRLRIAALVTLAGMVLGFSGLVVWVTVP